jgi:hypothetical protein
MILIANYRFLGVDSDTLSTVYKHQPKISPTKKHQSLARPLSFLRKHAAALLPSIPSKAKKERYRPIFDAKKCLADHVRAHDDHVCAAALLPERPYS